VSTPVVLPGLATSYAFIGRSDGHLQQIKLEGGRPQGIMQIATTSSQDVSDPSIDPDPQTGQSVVVVAGGKVARVAVPICADDPAAGASGCFDECVQPTNWDPYCHDTSCVTPSCRNPRFNPKYNPCTSLNSDSRFACIGLLPEEEDPFCDFGPGAGCKINLASVANGTPCDDGMPGSQGSIANKGAATCRSDAIPPPAACTLPEGSDCNYQTGASQPGSRFKCVTKPAVCGSVGGGKCCVCNDGFGMNCNDRCFQGACVSDLYTGCPPAGAGPARDSACIAAGDRACSAGLTCCGSNKGATCTSDSQCTVGPQGTCLDLNPLDADTSKSCYYQQCADLSDDPQHCGACGTDCGDYAISATACADNLGCGSCWTDLACAAFGAGQCVDGTCGKCRGNTTATGPACGAACTSDAQCPGGKCTGGFCCAAGSECVSGACRPLVCHRLADRGSCMGGICVGGGVCSAPSAADLAAAGQPGMCAIDFSRTNEPGGPSLCDAYASNYRTDFGAALVKIDATGATQSYTGVDATRLNGVSVSSDGGQLFASMVDTGTPGLALRPPGATVYSLVRDALPTGGLDDSPFDQAAFNSGPVGPAFDDVTFTNDASRKVWFGNFPGGSCGDQELCRVDFSSLSWLANEETYCNQPCADPDGHCEYSLAGCGAGSPQRITTLAFASRMYAPAGVHHRFLVVAHGTTLSFVDLDGGPPRQHDVNLASPAVHLPDVARGESTIEAILSIAPVPYGDVVLEVRGSGDSPAPGNVKNTWLININAHDRSVRHALDVQRSLKHVNPCGPGDSCQSGFSCVENACMKTCGTCPGGFTCVGGACRLEGEVPANFGIGAGLNAGNGRLGVMPGGRLVRWVAAVNEVPAGLSEFDTVPSPPASCDDGNACTLDGFDLASGLCEHLPVNCQDQDPCTSDTCAPATGQCVHAPVSCDDSDGCTADACEAGTGACLHTPILLAEPGPVQFATDVSIQWPPTVDASHWNTYRGTIPEAMLGSRLPGVVYDQVCFESADVLGDGPTTSTDAAVPPLGTGYYYLATGEASCESLLGHASSGAPIPNSAPCPTPP
jgi:hypothetical protein